MKGSFSSIDAIEIRPGQSLKKIKIDVSTSNALAYENPTPKIFISNTWILLET